MNKFKILSALSVLAIAVGLFGFAPGMALPAQATGTAALNRLQPLRHRRVHPTGGWERGLQLRFRGRTAGRATDLPEECNARRRPCSMTPTCGPVTRTTGTAPSRPARQRLLAGRLPQQSCRCKAMPSSRRRSSMPQSGTWWRSASRTWASTLPTAPNDPHSIHLHGLDVDAANDGVPETSVGAIPANLCRRHNRSTIARATPAPGAGNVVVYMFSPKYPGTTMYHCHQEADIHVQMGMYGALVVYTADDKNNAKSAYNKGGPGSGFGGTLWGWKYDKDYVLLESEIGSAQHVSEEISGDYNPVDYHPEYWFLNGLSFPNTIHVGLPGANGWSDWIAAHPGYDPLITGSVSKKSADGTKGEKVLIRMINMGYETQPMHMHGYHGKVIGSDQRAWPWANASRENGVWPEAPTPWGKGMEKNTLTIGSGETYEWLVNFGQQAVASTYPAGTARRRYDPATPTCQQSNTADGIALPFRIRAARPISVDRP